MKILRRYGLLLAVLIAPVILFLFPQYARILRYIHVTCIVLSTFVGRGFVQEGDARGWMIQTGALLAHTVCLVIEGTVFRGLV